MSSRAASVAREARGTTAVITSNASKTRPFAPPLDLTAVSCAAEGRPLVWMRTRTVSSAGPADSNSGASFEARFGAFFCFGGAAAEAASGEM